MPNIPDNPLLEKYDHTYSPQLPSGPDGTAMDPRNVPAGVTRMVADYEAIFGGREEPLRQLDAFLEDAESRTALLHAPTGWGKTALLIHWHKRIGQREGWRVLFVPISRRYQTATVDGVLQALAMPLAQIHDETLQCYNSNPGWVADRCRPAHGDLSR